MTTSSYFMVWKRLHILLLTLLCLSLNNMFCLCKHLKSHCRYTLSYTKVVVVRLVNKLQFFWYFYVPGSPDVTLSGPPSLSSDSSSPKHRSHAVSNNADPTAALPHGIQGHVVGMAYSAPDVTAITNTPARFYCFLVHNCYSYCL